MEKSHVEHMLMILDRIEVSNKETSEEIQKIKYHLSQHVVKNSERNLEITKNFLDIVND